MKTDTEVSKTQTVHDWLRVHGFRQRKFASAIWTRPVELRDGTRLSQYCGTGAYRVILGVTRVRIDRLGLVFRRGLPDKHVAWVPMAHAKRRKLCVVNNRLTGFTFYRWNRLYP